MNNLLRHSLLTFAMLWCAGAWSLGELPAKFRTLAEFAEQGDPDAQFFIGRHYFQISEDPAAADRARDWLTRSAAQNHAHAMLLLGELLELAYGRSEDLGESLSWYARAAELGLPEAQLRLGNFYFKGLAGLEQECAKALAWYDKARSGGIQVAASNMVWLLATCPDEGVRDGRRAVRMGMDIVYRQGMASANNLDNLAAAYAEAGDFLSAWETQEDAVRKLDPDHPEQSGFQARLQRYRERTPWRELPEPGEH